MKILPILITIVLLNSIISINIYLKNGKENTVNNIKANENYNFYINVTQYQKATVSLNVSQMSSSSNAISYAYIYEYSSTSSSYIYSKYQTISAAIKNKTFVSYFTYSINNYNTKYIVLKMVPNYNLNNITIKIDINGGVYYFVKGRSENIRNLKNGCSYYLCTPVIQFESGQINLNTSNMSPKPFSYLDIYEYLDITLTSYITCKTESFQPSTINNELVSSFKYSNNNYNTKNLCLKIIPNYNITYLSANFDFNGGAFDLINYINDGIGVYSLKAGATYLFYLSSNQNQMATFSLNMTSPTGVKPFSYVYINEYSSYDFKYPLSSNYTYVTFSSKGNNVFYTSINYSNKKYNMKFIAIKLIPSYDIYYLNTKINIEKNKYDLSSGNLMTINNLKKDNKYYFYIDTSNKKKVEVTLTSNNYNFNVKIYEKYSYFDNLDDCIYKNNEYITVEKNSFSYSTSSTSIQKVILEISPDTDIYYFSAKFDYLFTLSSQMIYISIICIVIIIAIIICICVRRKSSKSSNIFENSTQSQPLYPTNNSSNYQQQYNNLSQQQYNYSNQQQQYMAPQNQQNYQYQQQQYNMPQQQQYNVPQIQQYNMPQ